MLKLSIIILTVYNVLFIAYKILKKIVFYLLLSKI